MYFLPSVFIPITYLLFELFENDEFIKYIYTILFYRNRWSPRVVFADKVILIDECWMKVNIWKKEKIKS